jgi:response regulator RpfG family c-di-GMP phosphodiesterase
VPRLTNLRERRTEGLIRPTVLVVDGEALYRWFVRESLAPRGVCVVQCRTVAEAFSYLDRRGCADLLIVDAQTAADEGDGVMESLRQVSAAIPSLLFDSCAHGPHEQHVGNALVVDKPADSDVLFEMVDGQLHAGSRTA